MCVFLFFPFLLWLYEWPPIPVKSCGMNLKDAESNTASPMSGICFCPFEAANFLCVLSFQPKKFGNEVLSITLRHLLIPFWVESASDYEASCSSCIINDCTGNTNCGHTHWKSRLASKMPIKCQMCPPTLQGNTILFLLFLTTEAQRFWFSQLLIVWQ